MRTGGGRAAREMPDLGVVGEEAQGVVGEEAQGRTGGGLAGGGC